MNRLRLAAALLAVAAPASAAEVLKAVPAKLDPTKAYAIVEIRNFDDGKMAGTLVLARYDPAGGDVRGGLRSPASALPKGQGVRVAVSSHPIAKEKERRLYLVTLEPDTWVVEGSGGTAFSLGSRSFTVAAGEVIDLGVAAPATDYAEGEKPYKLTAGKLAGMALLGPFAGGMPKPVKAMVAFHDRGPADMALPSALRERAHPAAFSTGVKFGNYLGGLVNRIDGRAGRAAATLPSAEGSPPVPDTPPRP